MESLIALLTAIGNGGTSAIIIVLVSVIVWLIWEHVRLVKIIEKYQIMIDDNKTQYQDSIIDIIDRYHDGSIELIQALNEIKVVLATLQRSLK